MSRIMHQDRKAQLARAHDDNATRQHERIGVQREGRHASRNDQPRMGDA